MDLYMKLFTYQAIRFGYALSRSHNITSVVATHICQRIRMNSHPYFCIASDGCGGAGLSRYFMALPCTAKSVHALNTYAYMQLYD